MHASPVSRAPHRLAGATLFVCAAIAAIAAPGAAKAQAAAPANPSEVAPSERAKRDADKVFHWIMIQGDRTRKPSAAAATAAAPAARDDARSAAAKPARANRAEAGDAPARARTDTEVASAAPVTEVRRAPPDASAAPSAVTSALGLAAGSAGAATAVRNAAAASAAPLAAAPAIDKPGDAPEPAAAKNDELPGARVPAPEPAMPAQDAGDDAPIGLVVIAQPEPQFPIAVMRSLRRGTVQVKFSVQTDGSVSDLEVLHTTNPRINAAALAAIGQWRFQPIAKVQTGAVEVGFNLE